MDVNEVVVACPHCGQLHKNESLDFGAKASCTRCGTVLWTKSTLPIQSWLALNIATLIMFFIANSLPVATLESKGMSQSAGFLDSIFVAWHEGFYAVAIMCLIAGFIIPLIQILCLLHILFFLYIKKIPPKLSFMTECLHFCRHWSMIPVFMLGVLVAVIKLSDMATLYSEPGLFAFVVLTVLLTMQNRFSSKQVWRLCHDLNLKPILPTKLNDKDSYLCYCDLCGQVSALPHDHGHCIRCDSKVTYRKPHYKARTLAYLFTAMVFYLPANLVPVMEFKTAFGTLSKTIMGGIIQLWDMGSWDIAIIVFLASVVIPISKIAVLFILVIKSDTAKYKIQHQQTRIFQIVEFIGQWSMLDVFVVLLLAALANFGALLTVVPAEGAAPFGLVVIFTMMAALSFDLRPGWDMVKDYPAKNGQAIPDEPAPVLT